MNSVRYTGGSPTPLELILGDPAFPSTLVAGLFFPSAVQSEPVEFAGFRLIPRNDVPADEIWLVDATGHVLVKAKGVNFQEASA